MRYLRGMMDCPLHPDTARHLFHEKVLSLIFRIQIGCFYKPESKYNMGDRPKLVLYRLKADWGLPSSLSIACIQTEVSTSNASLMLIVLLHNICYFNFD